MKIDKLPPKSSASRAGRSAALLGAIGLLLTACSDAEPERGERTGVAADEVSGNIGASAIQIDGPPDGADLYANQGTPRNAGATLDWVATTTGNTGTGCLGGDSIATCVEPGVTGAAGGVGTWNGVRIVDGIGGADQNIFLSGGKENDVGTWTIGPGSIGSAKYDVTQAYLANGFQKLYFGMERRGNNGSTAFDFEFNARAPASAGCPQSPLIPCRSVGDVLFTFEMQGSGGSGSATPHVFTWSGAAYVEQTPVPSGILTSINDAITTAAPWGYVDSKGDWVLGSIPRFQLAEALVPVGVAGGVTLPGVDVCGGTAYVQVRTRSSATPTSDLKDTTKVFQFMFGGTTATATVTPTCNGFAFQAGGVDPAGNAIPAANLQCAWTFKDGGGNTVWTTSSCAGTNTSLPAGTYTGSVTVTDTASGCGGTRTTAAVNVYAPLSAQLTLTPTCASKFTYGVSVVGGSDPAGAPVALTFASTTPGAGTATPASSTSRSGEVAVSPSGISYKASLTVTDPRSDLPGQCTATTTTTTTPYAPLQVDLVPDKQSLTCPAVETSDAVTYTAVVSGGTGSYGYAWSGVCAGVTTSQCVIDPAEQDACVNISSTIHVTVTDSGAALCGSQVSEDETYTKVTTTVVNATNNP